MKPNPKKTNIKSTLFKAKIIFLLLLLFFIFSSFFAIYVGYKSGEIKKISQKINKSIIDFINMIATEEAKPKVIPPNSISIINVTNDATSEAKIIINEKNIKPTIYYPPKVQQQVEIKYVYPTYVYPTAIPGRPGSKEWDEEFWKKWDEMSKKNAESQKRVEESQKQFCIDNPNLCK